MNPADLPQAWKRREGMALLTDFYELTMLAGYLERGLAQQEACFEYFFRNLPPHNGFVLSSGLESFLDYLEHFHFNPEDLEYLRGLKLFDHEVMEYLAHLRLDVEVHAFPEGTPVFPHEPVVRVCGPLPHVQLVETFLLNALNYASLIATKTARICQAAQGEPVLEFGLRRAQGPDGGLTGSRAAFIGGAESTSNTLAGRLYGIPVRGTQAHSWIMAFPSEREAFQAFVDTFPRNCTLLVDTYDTLKSGVPNAIEIFKTHPELEPSIRLDSGDLAKLSKAAYKQFASAGMPQVRIIGTNDLDEDLIADLKRQGAKINVWAVGTHLITSKDHPALDGVYKLVALKRNGRWEPRIKVSGNTGKTSDPGVKRVVRCFDAEDHPLGDILCSWDEPLPKKGNLKLVDRSYLFQEGRLLNVARAEEMLVPVFSHGQRTHPSPGLNELRERARTQLGRFPEEYLRLRNPEIYPVGLSQNLARIKQDALAQASKNEA